MNCGLATGSAAVPTPLQGPCSEGRTLVKVDTIWPGCPIRRITYGSAALPPSLQDQSPDLAYWSAVSIVGCRIINDRLFGDIAPTSIARSTSALEIFTDGASGLAAAWGVETIYW